MFNMLKNYHNVKHTFVFLVISHLNRFKSITHLMFSSCLHETIIVRLILPLSRQFNTESHRNVQQKQRAVLPRETGRDELTIEFEGFVATALDKALVEFYVSSRTRQGNFNKG